jgi:hypothetical protein
LVVCQLLTIDDGFNRSTNVVIVVVVGITDIGGSIINILDRFEIDSCECCWCFRSVLSKSIGVAGGELVSTFVVSRIVISAAKDRPQAQTKR